ncbi:F-box/kelch-repeat protein, partial [Trifolium medium]|nr:F-box/kelch-repeat protein [Trifolium medium]
MDSQSEPAGTLLPAMPTDGSQTDFSCLPLDLVQEILARVPVKDLVRSRSVSQLWNRVTYQKKFILKHASLANPHLFLSFSESSTVFNLVHRIDGEQISLESPFDTEYKLIQVIGSSHGIMCLVESGNVILWNPSIRKKSIFLTNLCSSVVKGQHVHVVYGFGHTHEFEFKFAAIEQFENEAKSIMKIGTAGPTSWTNINELALDFNSFDLIDSAKLVQESLNWFSGKEIVCLDLNKEKIRMLKTPNCGGTWSGSKDTIGCWKDKLGFLCRDTMLSEVWIMQIYGDEKSWIKLFSIPHLDVFGSPYVNGIHYISENNKTLMTVMKDFKWELIVFDPNDKKFENYAGNKDMLGKCEQVPRVESKLRVFAFKITFSAQVSDLRINLNTINDATRETIVTLGNALNQVKAFPLPIELYIPK